jgi:hypothetical protein
MTDITFALEAKSNQLNAVDIMGCNRIIKIRDVKVTQSDQPVAVYFDGDNNRPWMPSKGMRRILAGAWGKESQEWIGKHAELYFEPSVMWAGKPVGGIRIKALTDIPAKGLELTLAISKQKREIYTVHLLTVKAETYPADRFEKALPVMAAKMEAGEMTLQQVIAQCQKTGQLTNEQHAALEAAAPVENENEEEEMM